MSVFLKYREWVLAAIIGLMVTGISLYAPAFGTLDNATGVLNRLSFHDGAGTDGGDFDARH